MGLARGPSNRTPCIVTLADHTKWRTNLSSKDYLDYNHILFDALRTVVHNVIQHTSEHGLLGEHHFYINFLTSFDDVKIPKNLQAQYPSEMTIVLQNQFEILEVNDRGFEIILSFSQKPATLFVPWLSILSFTDPSVNFTLQFPNITETQDQSSNVKTQLHEVQPHDIQASTDTDQSAQIASIAQSKLSQTNKTKTKKTSPKTTTKDQTATSRQTKKTRATPSKGADIISLDNFKKRT